MHIDSYCLLDQQFRVRARVIDDVIRHAAQLRGSVMLPVAIGQTMGMVILEIHRIALLAVHNQMLLAIIDKKIVLAEFHHVRNSHVECVMVATQVEAISLYRSPSVAVKSMGG
jgi:hypothetical protein